MVAINFVNLDNQKTTSMTNGNHSVEISQQEYKEYIFYKQFIKHMNATMYSMNLDPYKLSWISNNNTLSRILGMTAEQMLEQGEYIMANLLKNPDFSESVTIALEKFKEDPDINWAGVYRIKDINGEPKWALYSASTMEKDENGVATKSAMVAFPLDDVFNTPETLRQLQSYIKDRINAKEVELLTAKQKQILIMLGRGKSRTAVAESLGISVYTVDDHKKAIGKKFACNSSTEIVKLAQRLGLV